MKLSDYMKNKDINQSELAIKAGINISIISRFLLREKTADPERGRGLSLGSALAISKATRGSVSVEELLKSSYDPTKSSSTSDCQGRIDNSDQSDNGDKCTAA